MICHKPLYDRVARHLVEQPTQGSLGRGSSALAVCHVLSTFRFGQHSSVFCPLSSRTIGGRLFPPSALTYRLEICPPLFYFCRE